MIDKQKFELIIFDMDGLMFDTEKYHLFLGGMQQHDTVIKLMMRYFERL
jgi:hypothetical protein